MDIHNDDGLTGIEALVEFWAPLDIRHVQLGFWSWFGAAAGRWVRGPIQVFGEGLF